MIKYITTTDKKFEEFMHSLGPFMNPVMFDTETTGLDPRLSDILLAQFFIDDVIYVINVPKLGSRAFKEAIESIDYYNVQLVAHNAKFDWKFIYHHTGVALNSMFDTMNCECVLNAGIGSSTYSLEDLASRYCNEQLDKSIRESFFNEESTGEFTELQILYSANDVKVLKDIYYKQIERVKEAKEVEIINLEMGIIPVVAKMEYDGILLDKEAWSKLEKIALRKAERYTPVFKKMLLDKNDFSQYKNAFEARRAYSFPKNITKRDKEALWALKDANVIKDWICDNINIGSSYQVKAALNNIDVPVENTNAKYLELKFGNIREVQALLKIREQQKRASSFGSNIFEKIHPITGRVHAEYLNNGASTGRMSYSYHNIPRLREYRNAFSIAREGWSILSVDYSQAEYRLAGAVSGEPAIIKAYIEGKDMHYATAAFHFQKDIKDVTKSERQFCKNINFLMIYGGTAWGIMNKFNIKMKEAERIENNFYSSYPIFAEFKRISEEKIIELGYSVTPMGRRRYMPEKPMFMDSGQYVSWIARQKRELFNHIIQGGSADSVKLSMLEIYNKNPFGDKLRLLQQEHDEVVVEVHNSIAEEANEFVVKTMEECFQPMLGSIPALAESSGPLPYWTK